LHMRVQGVLQSSIVLSLLDNVTAVYVLAITRVRTIV